LSPLAELVFHYPPFCIISSPHSYSPLSRWKLPLPPAKKIQITAACSSEDMTCSVNLSHERKRSFSRGKITQWQSQKAEKLPPAVTYERSGEQGCLKKSKRCR